MSDTTTGPLPTHIGWAMLAVQPLYILVEVALSFTTSSPYSLLDNTISDLGATTCTDITYAYGPVAVCSPLHAVMNGAFVVSGIALIVGALLSRRSWPERRSSTVALWLIAVGGVSSVATGLVPLDVDLELHVLVSAPSFIALQLAMFAAARAFTGFGWISTSAWIIGAVTVASSVAFFTLSGSEDFGGLLERLALWPVFLWMGWVGTVGTRSRGLHAVSDRPR
ncbi:hypothetical protein GCM10007304_11260 [Rhodococcoides trifolii]|uniref:DUF998 domain-containing protein n=1 Tax=Rhodococcoides trifolii TaxID=908250 RepID=A0A917CTI9_9NOCA|nr:DUF998 domain-containing protein [Rhodococcus trifolii]GGF99130.1 hypothetical protein GCM10007304_11260 [Rhodococcus trifolii]